jgi:hypothetical protein
MPVTCAMVRPPLLGKGFQWLGHSALANWPDAQIYLEPRRTNNERLHISRLFVLAARDQARVEIEVARENLPRGTEGN